jgi:hypothetical protein
LPVTGKLDELAALIVGYLKSAFSRDNMASEKAGEKTWPEAELKDC